MNENRESGVLFESDWGTVMFERMPDGRRRAYMLKDEAYRDRIEQAETLGLAYTRFSSHGQNESTTEVQLEVIFAMAKKQDTAIVEAYCDEGRSGTNDRRPDFQRMVADVKQRKLKDLTGKRKVSIVAVYKLDRFSRGRYDPGYYKYILGKSGVRVVSASEQIPDGAIGPLVESNLEAAAAFFSAQLSERITEYMHSHALNCETNGMYVPGLVRGPDAKFTLDPDLHSLMRDMVSDLADGISVERIEARMAGVVDKRGRGFDAVRIRKLAHDRRLAGEYRYDSVVIPDGMPALVSMDVLERAAAKVDRANARKAQKIKHTVKKQPNPPTDEQRARMRYKHNIAGRRFGDLKVIEVARLDKNHHRIWLCECRCGRKVEVYATRLKTGKATCCGVCHPSRGYDLAGAIIGGIEVIEPVGLDEQRHRVWRCRERNGAMIELSTRRLMKMV